MIPLTITRDVNGFATSGENLSRRFSDANQYFTLTGSSITTVTVPINPNPVMATQKCMAFFTFVSLSQNAEVWVLPAASPTLTLPSGTVTATLAELNPVAREVVFGQTIQFLTSQSDVSVGIAYYVVL